jgi:arylsulfatase A-like enzyme
MFRNLLYIMIVISPAAAVASDTIPVASSVFQPIIYKTTKASEVYFVWTMNNWKVPDEDYHPAGTFIKNGMAFTKMNGSKDSFYVNLPILKGNYIDFMFWATKDRKGDSLEAWDNNWGSSYNFYVDGKGEKKILSDEKLYVVQKEAPKKLEFKLLYQGSFVLIAGVIVLLFSLSIKVIFRYKNAKFSSQRYFIISLFFSSLLVMLLTRIEMNAELMSKPSLILGAAYYDLEFISLLAVLAVLLFRATSKHRRLRSVVFVFVVLSILTAVFASLANIEVVRQLGKPLTYNWLYYSDFLKGADAQNAIKAVVTPSLIKSIAYIFIGITVASIGFSIFHQLCFKNRRTALLFWSLFFCLCFGTSLVQHRSHSFDLAKVENPMTALVLSWMSSGSRAQLFTMKVTEDAKGQILNMHSKRPQQLAVYDSIKNVVLFVYESTPAHLVQPYDTTFSVTPNLNRWKQHARVYKNMYAHLPTTMSSMLSIISGIYPNISYKSIVYEYPSIAIPSLPNEVKRKGWNTSLFFSSDLSYSKMDMYLKSQGVETAEDFKTISCDHKSFSSNYAQLDGLDDRCIVSRYFDWRKKTGERTLSILWSNQTHYPYFFAGEEKPFSTKPELNKYLNALEEVDIAFGQLMAGLEKRKEIESTLVIVIGDHGEAFGTHHQYTHGANIYEENVRVPCLVINPRLFKGETDNRIGGMIDIAPTITHVLQLQQPEEWEGSSLLDSYRRDHAFFIGPYSDFQFGSRFENWKLIYNAANNRFQLFDLAKDPGELKNVAAENEKIVKNEYKLMAAWVQYHNKKIDGFLKRGLNPK